MSIDNVPKITPEIEERAAEQRKKVYTEAESREKEKARDLLKVTISILHTEKLKGKGRLAENIDKTAENVHEYTREGQVVFLPKGTGRMIVLGDIHGDLDAVKQVLDNENFFIQVESDHSTQLIFLGDLVDRGNKQVELMQLLMVLKREYPENVTFLRGDHEAFDGIEPHTFNDEIKKFYHGLDMYHQDEFEIKFNDLFHKHKNQLLPTMKDKITTEVSEKLLEDIKQNLCNSIVNPAWETDTEWNIDTSAEQVEAFCETYNIPLEDQKQIKKYIKWIMKESFSRDPYYTDSVFADYFKENGLFAEMPRMAVAAIGAVIVHGGPAEEPRTLLQLAQLSDEESEQVFDQEIIRFRFENNNISHKKILDRFS